MFLDLHFTYDATVLKEVALGPYHVEEAQEG